MNNLRRSKADRNLIKAFDDELLQQKVDYFEKTGQKFPIPAEDIAFEFVYTYYDILDNERSIGLLMPYYKKESVFNINGHAKFFGQGHIIRAIMVHYIYI